MSFKPSPSQLEAAEDLFVFQCMYQVTKPLFDNLEKELLREGNYRYDDYWYKKVKGARELHLPVDRIIRDIKDVSMMAGLRGNEVSESSDAGRYFSALRYNALAIGLLEGENTICKMEWEIVQRERCLVESLYEIHGIPLDKVYSLTDRKKLVDICLSLVGSFIDNNKVQLKLKERYGSWFSGKPLL